MKAILVIDKPENCGDCPLFIDNGSTWCAYSLEDVTSNKTKPKACPLKPMPEKKEAELNEKHFYFKEIIEYAIYKGYNKCIEDILRKEK